MIEGKLQDAIGRALENVAMRRFQLDENIYFAGEAEEPSLDLLVRPLLSGGPGGASSDAVVAVLVANLTEVSRFPVETVRSLYSLTRVEVELVQLLVEGATLNEAAEHRGVALR